MTVQKIPVAIESVNATVRTSTGREIYQLFRPFVLAGSAATIIGVAGGLATAWLIRIVNDALHGQEEPGLSFFLTFLGLCMLGIIGSAIGGIANSVIGQRVIAALRKDISRRVTDAPLETVERLRPHKILAILANDIETVSAFTFNLSGYAASLAIVIGCVAYIATLSVPAFLIFCSAILAASALTAYSKAGWSRDYASVRDSQDHLQQQYRAITEGAKELRLNRARAAQVHDDHLARAVDTISARKISAMKRFWLVSSVTSGVVFVAIGLLLLGQRSLHLEPLALTGTILVIFYIRSPIEQLLGGLPAFFQAKISFQRIALLSAGLKNRTSPPTTVERGGLPCAAFEGFRLQDVSYEFPNDEGRGFKMDRVTLDISAGEMLFITGENGSGKTTLIKLILGLYQPRSGSLLLNGTEIGAGDVSAYRQLFSAVFSDYHLFADVIASSPEKLAVIETYLLDLEIRHKVEVRDGRFTTLDLSTGQRKRLALIHAYLEDRPVILFDEWAADQDPTFRRVFYERILPDLKRQGKTLIVVSHDDRFFNMADRIILLKEGRILDDNAAKSLASALKA